ncbi:MAG: hypothetical protein H6825_02730 [Planctomycetes bacterium]|nr:hypothetical protein [Planctomycetota bacterium]
MTPIPRRESCITSLAIALALLCGTASAGDPLLKLTAADGESGDKLGAAVGTEGTLAVLGAPADDANGTQSGSAYVFDVTTGQQVAKFVPPDGVAFDSFGFAVGLGGGVAIGGAYKDDDLGSASGSATLFDPLSGAVLHKLTADDGAAGDQFGFSVGIGGGKAVAGAQGVDDLGSASGAAYVFDVATGAQLHELHASDGAANDFFGNSCATDGLRVIVGAPGKASSRGAAYLYDATSGAQLAIFTPTSFSASQYFGRAVAVSGNRAVVGAPFAGPGGAERGEAYLFNTTTGALLATLTASDGADGDRFGDSVAVRDGLVVVGAWDNDALGDVAGAAYVFDASTGSRLGKLTAHDATPGARFGTAVATSDTRVLIGAVSTKGANPNAGAGYAFPLDGAPWKNLVHGKAGVAGTPSMLGLGDLTGGSFLSLTLGHAAPNATMFLVLGVADLSLPFKGGTLVPSPDFVFGGLPTGPAGTFSLETVWPVGIPSGVPLYVQAWIQDGSVFPPFAASNGVTQTTP